MEADFSGYATKAGVKCADGRTILPGAFKHQDKMKVPLVWQHGHSSIENVLGHALLEDREGSVYAHAFFNETANAKHAKDAVSHKDITAMSIFANQLVERGGNVLHGMIREVSLVLSGANPGALIENVTIHHGDEDILVDDEVIIYSGTEFEHSIADDDASSEDESEDESSNAEESSDEDESSSDEESNEESEESSDDESDDSDESVQHADGSTKSVQEIFEAMTEEEQNVVAYMVTRALEASGVELQQDNLDSDDTKKGSEMANVFEKKDEKPEAYVLTHADVSGIVADATKIGSLRDAVENFAISHGIDQIDTLFPEAHAIDSTPEFLARRTEWVSKVFGGATKSPFSRIKTLSADITEDEARAKGYITGTLKKEEFFGVAKRVTTPTTVYKKQKLDRDDVVDITDFDVVAWLKGEMRLLLDEEVARAILVGDGRDVAHEDKINEQNIRPIASDHPLFVTTVNVNIADANSSISELIDAIVGHRHAYKGTGLPSMFTTETVISKFLLLKDTLGRYIYSSLDEVATKLRVAEIVPVEVMEETPEVLAILVNMNDYTVGATAGGKISLFDDFDIDYNQYKYLIETRMCGCLTKLRSAIVVKGTEAASQAAVPTAPVWDAEAGTVEIPVVTGVDYQDADGNVLSGTDTVAEGATLVVTAVPKSGYHFASSAGTTWTFTNRA